MRLNVVRRMLLCAALCGFALTSGCAAHVGKLTDIQRSERLATEKGRLAELKDPVARTKSYITISQLLLEFSAAAARDQDVESLDKLLDQYNSAIKSARDTIVNS